MSAPERPRRFVRTRRGRLVGGVCSGLGDYFGVDALLLRIAFVALTFLFGIGFAAYGLILLLTVEEGAPRPPIAYVRWRVALGSAALLGALLWLVDVAGHEVFDDSWPAVGAVLCVVTVGAIAAALRTWLRRRAAGRRRTPDERLASALAFGTVVGAAGVLLGAGGFWVAGLEHELAAWAIVATGLVVIAGAFGRRRRWLLPAAVVFSVPAAVALAADVDLHGGAGEKTYRIERVEDLRSAYRLGAGHLTVDLRDVALPAGVTTLDVRLGAGELDVLVPSSACVLTEATIGAGYVGALDREDGGLDVDWANRPAARGAAPRLRIRAHVGIGALFVADRALGHGKHRFSPGEFGDNDACRTEAVR